MLNWIESCWMRRNILWYFRTLPQHVFIPTVQKVLNCKCYPFESSSMIQLYICQVVLKSIHFKGFYEATDLEAFFKAHLIYHQRNHDSPYNRVILVYYFFLYIFSVVQLTLSSWWSPLLKIGVVSGLIMIDRDHIKEFKLHLVD